MQIKIGDRIRDNDPRNGGRMKTVVQFRGPYAVDPTIYAGYTITGKGHLGPHIVWVNTTRIFAMPADGKPRAKGWTLLPPVGPMFAAPKGAGEHPQRLHDPSGQME
jgi:hypothetical protein